MKYRCELATSSFQTQNFINFCTTNKGCSLLAMLFSLSLDSPEFSKRPQVTDFILCGLVTWFGHAVGLAVGHAHDHAVGLAVGLAVYGRLFRSALQIVQWGEDYINNTTAESVPTGNNATYHHHYSRRRARLWRHRLFADSALRIVIHIGDYTSTSTSTLTTTATSGLEEQHHQIPPPF